MGTTQSSQQTRKQNSSHGFNGVDYHTRQIGAQVYPGSLNMVKHNLRGKTLINTSHKNVRKDSFIYHPEVERTPVEVVYPQQNANEQVLPKGPIDGGFVRGLRGEITSTMPHRISSHDIRDITKYKRLDGWVKHGGEPSSKELLPMAQSPYSDKTKYNKVQIHQPNPIKIQNAPFFENN
tara:strand:+ start:3402 stop:3938 length:537 start_codon:yes stop_codon:yes gene_type:complete